LRADEIVGKLFDEPTNIRRYLFCHREKRRMHNRLHAIRFAVLAAAVLGTTLWVSARALAQGATPKRITVSLSDVSINKVAFLVAENEGLYKKYGLDVVMTPFSAGAARVHGIPDEVPKAVRDAVVNANISIGGGAPGMVDKATSSEPNDRVIIGTTDAIVHWDIVARKGITSIQQLKGKRFAISSPSACTGVVARILAEHMGWDPDQDMAILEGNYSPTPLEKDWADALIAYEVPLAAAMKLGYKPLADVDMRSWNEPIACNGIWTSKSWAHANHDAVIAYLKALTEAISMMKKDKEVAFRAIAKYYKITDREQSQVIYNGAEEMPRKPYPTVEGIKRTMELYNTAAMRRFKPEDFYDDSFMKELDQSGFIDNLYK
jgi:ABC-type nitrate/sulfonate/bicarbonate transport system substrate-binding protein